MNIVPAESIQRKILMIRGRRVMLDRDLAELYEVETKALNRAVKRNITRFPDDFMFRLSQEEYAELLRCHFGTSVLVILTHTLVSGFSIIPQYCEEARKSNPLTFRRIDNTNRGLRPFRRFSLQVFCQEHVQPFLMSIA